MLNYFILFHIIDAIHEESTFCVTGGITNEKKKVIVIMETTPS